MEAIEAVACGDIVRHSRDGPQNEHIRALSRLYCIE